jgi:septal ring factor EnvC (AmiA/AmiB activator)
MKILAMFLLSGFFIFSAGVPLRAQACSRSKFGEVTVKDIVDYLDCVGQKAESLEHDKYYLESKIDDLQRELDQTKLELHTAETKIEMLESTLKSDEHMTEAMFSLFARTGNSKPAANKPKAPVSKPKPAVDSSKNQ